MKINQESETGAVKGISLPILIVILVILVLIVIIFVMLRPKQESLAPVELIADNNLFKLSIPGEINFQKKDSSTLDIYSCED